jgi:hypothetical protein
LGFQEILLYAAGGTEVRAMMRTRNSYILETQDANCGDKDGIDPFSFTSIARTRTQRFIAVASTMRGDAGVRGHVKVDDGGLGSPGLKVERGGL